VQLARLVRPHVIAAKQVHLDEWVVCCLGAENAALRAFCGAHVDPLALAPRIDHCGIVAGHVQAPLVLIDQDAISMRCSSVNRSLVWMVAIRSLTVFLPVSIIFFHISLF